MKNYRYLQRKYMLNTYPDRELNIIAGEGIYLIDIFGEKYLDLMTNYGVNIFGYSHSHLIQSLTNQLQKLTILHGSFSNDRRAEAAKSLVKRCGGGLAQVYFSNSGSEAVEASLKFAVLATGKMKFISCRSCYHGKTLGALSASDTKYYTDPFQPLLWNFEHVEFNNISQLEKALDNKTAAFLVEPIQGEGGINVPDPGYLKQAKDLCESNGALLILDEIQTGVGRTGSFLASQDEGFLYDIVCLGKGLAGGLPVGATLVSQQVAQKIPRSIHTSTFGGNPLVCTGIMETLVLLNDEILSHIKEVGDYFLNELRKIASEFIVEFRGKGLMLGIEVNNKRDVILKELQQEKVLSIPASHNVIRFLPPYIVERNHVDMAIQILKRIFKRL